MFVYPLSPKETRVIGWATVIVPALAVALLVFWGWVTFSAFYKA